MIEGEIVMRRKMVMVFAATMVASALLVGCGSSGESNNANGDVAISTEQNDSGSNEQESSAKEEATVVEVGEYNEKFYEMPDFSEYDDNEKYKASKILEYEVSKFVFEDMTRRFKNKEEVSTTNGVCIVGMPDFDSTSFVCDVNNIVPPSKKGGVYTEFGGFDVDTVMAFDRTEIKDYVAVELKANSMKDKGSPMWMSAYVTVGDNGEFGYKELSIEYKFKN